MKNKTLLILALVWSISFIHAQTTIQYTSTDSLITNPERGFYHADPHTDVELLQSYLEEEHISVIYFNFALDEFKDSYIAAWYLRNMYADFAVMRQAGVKAVVRFTYTEKDTPPYGDAPLDIVLGHIAQLKPVLQDNVDVILALQAGFIGTWGEWYYTDYYSTTPGNISEEQMGWRRQIVHALLDAIPQRMVQLRTPLFKKNMVPLNEYIPVSSEEAFQDTPIARIAHHNDCFLASTTDYGTYQNIAVEKPYLEQDTKFTMIGGETCNENYLSVCDNALVELERFHWTFLNRDYHSGVFQQWIEGGCYPEIEKRLGYRYRLISAQISDESKPLGSLDFHLQLYNDGWANVMNPRDVKLVLRNTSTNEEFSHQINTDPRLWPLNDTIKLDFTAGLHQNIPNGDYQVFLQMPAPEASIHNRAVYAIHLANENIWEAETGYNSLLHSINISSDNTAEIYEGGNFFTGNEAEIPQDIHIIIDGDPGDWENIKTVYSAFSQNAKTLKVYQSPDSLFFIINGENLHEDWQIFLNSDDDANTGYISSEWQKSGADYLVEDGSLYYYTGNGNSWDWTLIKTITSERNTEVLELKVGLNHLSDWAENSSFSLAFIDHYQQIAEASYLPLLGENYLSIHKSSIFAAPAFVEVHTVANRAVVSWTSHQPTKGVTAELERSTNGDDYQKIFTTINRHQFAYSDQKLDSGHNYQYRVRFTDGENHSAFTPSTPITITGQGQSYADIHIDGENSDWDMIEPIITDDLEGLASIKIYNTSSDFYFSIKANQIDHYQFFISESIHPHYKISNDSLFVLNNIIWEFQSLIQASSSNGFMEASIPYSRLFSEDITAFYSHALINGQHLLSEDEDVYSYKFNILTTPENFRVIPSINDPYGSIKLKWKMNSKTGGYVIQRSVGDSLHFEDYQSLSHNAFYFMDHDLDSSLVYFYRIFSHRDIVRSPYTAARWLQPNGSSSLDEFETAVKIYPNPIKQYAKLELYSLAAQEVEINILNNNGRKIETVYQGQISGQQFIPLDCSSFPRGVYILQLRGEKKVINRKLIII
jgi:hypothetical protein